MTLIKDYLKATSGRDAEDIALRVLPRIPLEQARVIDKGIEKAQVKVKGLGPHLALELMLKAAVWLASNDVVFDGAGGYTRTINNEGESDEPKE